MIHKDKEGQKGDGTMSAVSQNYSYRVRGKKSTGKAEPVVTADRLAKIKQSVGKYLDGKR